MKYCITTPIYYVNDAPHIGHAYTSVASDVLARNFRLKGEVFFLTGTDEHGQKIEKAALLKGIEPLEFCDEVSQKFKALSLDFNLSNNDFIRTTEERHKSGVLKFWEKLEANNWIYKGFYKGWYAIRDEAFYSEDELIDGKAPTGAEVVWQEEESYFFRLSEFTDLLTLLYTEIPSMIFPSSRLNEVKAFVSSGLKDLSISRTSFKWGISCPSNEKHVIYVWLDALTNYITALGYPNGANYQTFWGNNWTNLENHAEIMHIIGKDILRFHAVFWPAFLIAERYTLAEVQNCLQANISGGNKSDSTTSPPFFSPSGLTESTGFRPPNSKSILHEIKNFFSHFKVVSHGWWKNNGEKMSKSLGNAINPYDLINKFGLDKVRYFFLREVPFGGDGDFNEERFISITNADLANNIGNLTQRVMSFIYANCNGKIPQYSTFKALHSEESIHSDNLNGGQHFIQETQSKQQVEFENFNFSKAIDIILDFARKGNEIIDKSAPWKLKKEERFEEMNDVLYLLAMKILAIYKMLAPIVPESAIKGLKIFDGENKFPTIAEILKMGKKEQDLILENLLKLEVKPEALINKPEIIFARI